MAARWIASARVHANPRVHDALEANEGSFAHEAESNSYHAFNLMVGDWVRVVDQDGTRNDNQRSHEKRDVKLHQDLDGTWSLSGGCASLQGVELNTILKRFIEAEFRTDWAKARAEHGDAATTAHLARTDAQRRFDALFAIFQKAADAHAAAPGGSRIVTDVVIDQDTFERLAAILAGGTVEEPDPLFSAFPATKYRCSTLDGEPVEATEAVAQALIGHIRRVVIGSDSVVIDLGRERRLFTGAAALAVKLSQTTCSWPGCLVPVTQCQCDHVEPWTTTARRPWRRVYLPRQRGVLLWETQPGEGTRLHRPPRPRQAAGTPTAPTAPRSNDRSRPTDWCARPDEGSPRVPAHPRGRSHRDVEPAPQRSGAPTDTERAQER